MLSYGSSEKDLILSALEKKYADRYRFVMQKIYSPSGKTSDEYFAIEGAEEKKKQGGEASIHFAYRVNKEDLEIDLTKPAMVERTVPKNSREDESIDHGMEDEIGATKKLYKLSDVYLADNQMQVSYLVEYLAGDVLAEPVPSIEGEAREKLETVKQEMIDELRKLEIKLGELKKQQDKQVSEIEKMEIASKSARMVQEIRMMKRGINKTDDDLVKKDLRIMPALKALTFRQRLKSMRDIFEQLDVLHKNKYVHGDINYGNIMLDVDAKSGSVHAKLFDFGLSKFLDDKPHIVIDSPQV